MRDLPNNEMWQLAIFFNLVKAFKVKSRIIYRKTTIKIAFDKKKDTKKKKKYLSSFYWDLKKID